MNSIQLKVQRTAHIYLVGKPSPLVKRFVIACHGYGDSAEIFSKKFEDLDDGQTLVAIPKALSSFYFVDPRSKNANPYFNMKPGASWMTSDGRDAEIEDYTNYLSQVYAHFVPQLHPEVRITLLGFSQGGVTAMRFAALKQPLFHNLVLWASDLAKDLNYEQYRDYLNNKSITFVRCLEDQFISPDKFIKLKGLIEEKGLVCDYVDQEGTHRVNKKILNKLSKNWF